MIGVLVEMRYDQEYLQYQKLSTLDYENSDWSVEKSIGKQYARGFFVLVVLESRELP